MDFLARFQHHGFERVFENFYQLRFFEPQGSENLRYILIISYLEIFVGHGLFFNFLISQAF